NISSSGEKIYHMPGQRYYNKTVISESKGERWFCSEEEAQKAGWRKSKL
ncbi:MAG TPA: thermonuclease family protein, partial [Candidatus Nanoarchaeia archaeon]